MDTNKNVEKQPSDSGFEAMLLTRRRRVDVRSENMRRTFLFLMVAAATLSVGAIRARANSGMFGSPYAQQNPFLFMDYCDFSCRAMGGPGFTPFSTPQEIGQMPAAFGSQQVAMAMYLQSYGARPIGLPWNPARGEPIGLDNINANMAAWQLGL
jgi:hypothetical protein